MKKTHDGQIVYPKDASLPQHAIGWTQCNVQTGAYTCWLNPEDCARAKADLEKIADVINKIRTKVRASRVCERLAIYPRGKLSDMKSAIINTVYSDRWPLREN